MSRLTREEQQTIIQLYERGCSMAEIKDKTGRSRDAIALLLRRTGLDKIQVDRDILREAEYEYKKWYGKTKDAYGPFNFEDLHTEGRKKWINQAKGKIIEKCKLYRDMIMSDIESPAETDQPITKTKQVDVDLPINHLSASYIKSVLDSMTDDQKIVLNYLVGQAFTNNYTLKEE